MTKRARLVTSCGPGRLRAAEAWLRELGHSVLVVAPTAGAAHDLARSAACGGGLLNVRCLSRRQFITELVRPLLAARCMSPLSRLGAEAMVSRAVTDAFASHPARFFGEVCELPGFPRAATRTLTALVENGVSPEQLEADLAGCRDLSQILKELRRLEVEKGLACPFTLLEAALEVLGSGEASLPAKRLLLLDPAPDSALEDRLIGALAGHCDQLLVTCPTGDRETLRRLSRVLEVAAEPADEVEARDSQLQRLQELLFAGGGEVRSEDDSFSFFSAPSEGRECVELARAVQRFANSGVPYDRMAVWLRDPGLYLPHLQDALHRAGIPAYYTAGTVRPNPAGRAFLSLLDCAAQNLSAARFAEYLSLAQVPKTEVEPSREVRIPWVLPSGDGQLTFATPIEMTPGASGSPRRGEGDESLPVIPYRWEDLLVEASVVGGVDRWERRLKGLLGELRLKLADASEEEAAVAHLQARLDELRQLEEFALPLIHQLEALPRSASWGKWIELLRTLAVSALRDPEPVLRLLSELTPMAEVGPVGLTEVRGVLADHLLFLRSEPPDDRYGRLLVGSLEEAAGRKFEIVFVPGMAEGVLPKKVFEDPLLLDSTAAELGLKLPTRFDRIVRERRLLIRAAAGVERVLTVSFPRMDLLQGRARVPSLYALEVLTAARGQTPELKELERRSPDEPLLRLGWPAPADPAQAIDDAEYDLAILEPLLHRRQEPSRGRGRFLLSLNPWLARSLRARFKRWEPEWSDDDGLNFLRHPETRRRLARFRLRERAYSPTALQTYSACPYRFFLHAIQRLRPREGIVQLDQMDPLVRGSLLHEAQFEFFESLSQEQALGSEPSSLENWLDLGDRVLNRISDRYAEELAPALPGIWRSEVEDLRVDLRSWIRDRHHIGREWIPYRWELSFGLSAGPGRDAHSEPREAVLKGGYRLRGVIDLVERHLERGVLRVTDHKSGRAPERTVRLVGGGELLQPLLYAMAVERILSRECVGGRLHYCTQRGQFRIFDFALENGPRKVVEWILDTIDEAVAKGFLPAAPKDQACSHCDYRPVCGPYEEIRVKRKPLSQLKSLLEMREIE